MTILETFQPPLVVMRSGEVTDLSSEKPHLERDVEREMREEWDARARDNAFHYIDDSKDEWRPEEFFASGEDSVRQFILNDMGSICQGMSRRTCLTRSRKRASRTRAATLSSFTRRDSSADIRSQLRMLERACSRSSCKPHNLMS